MYRTLQPFQIKKLTTRKVLKILIMITIGLIVLVLGAAMIPQLFRYKDRLLEFSFVLNMVLIGLILLRVTHYMLYRARKGEFTGSLLLSKESIELNGNTYPISSLKKIRFIGNDIKGDFRGYDTKGTENQIILTQNDGAEVVSNFEQTVEKRLQDEHENLSAYRSAGKLSEANYDNILNNTNYY